jgi:hypothetical protein
MMEEFIKQFREILNIKAIQDKAGLTGNHLHKIIREEKYRRISTDQEAKLKGVLLPLYEGLEKLFEKKD